MTMLQFLGKRILCIEGRKEIEESMWKPHVYNKSDMWLFIAVTLFIAAITGFGFFCAGHQNGRAVEMESIRQLVRDNNGKLVLHVSMFPQGVLPSEYANIWDLDENKIVRSGR